MSSMAVTTTPGWFTELRKLILLEIAYELLNVHDLTRKSFAVYYGDWTGEQGLRELLEFKFRVMASRNGVATYIV